MDAHLPEPEPGTKKHLNRFSVSLTLLASILNWLAGLIKLTKEEQEDAGIYLDRPQGE